MEKGKRASRREYKRKTKMDKNRKWEENYTERKKGEKKMGCKTIGIKK